MWILDTKYIYVEVSGNFYLFESSMCTLLFVSLIVIARFLYFRATNLCAVYFFLFEFIISSTLLCSDLFRTSSSLLVVHSSLWMHILERFPFCQTVRELSFVEALAMSIYKYHANVCYVFCCVICRTWHITINNIVKARPVYILPHRRRIFSKYIEIFDKKLERNLRRVRVVT